MGIVFIMFAELWVQFFKQNGTFPSKIRLSLTTEARVFCRHRWNVISTRTYYEQIFRIEKENIYKNSRGITINASSQSMECADKESAQSETEFHDK